MHGLPLAEGEVHLWHVFSDPLTDPELLGRYRGLLCEDELARYQRFVFQRAGHQFLVTRALLRTVLSTYAGCDPREWVFRRNAYGKPAIAEPAGLPLCFNLSHTAGLVTCAVTADHDVGVDVEDLERAERKLPLAARYFAPAEAAALQRCPAAERAAGFLQFWTLKEAYLKARGRGLSLPLTDFAFTLFPDRPPAISFATGGRDRPFGGSLEQTTTDGWSAWQFARIRLGRRYQIAVAVRLPHPVALTILWRETVPLRRDGVGRVLPASATNEWFL